MADVGFAGTMICAVFESLGYRYQSYILTQMVPSFENELGPFLYLIGICVAIFSVATRGSYKLFPWLIIGPPMFFMVVLTREEVEDAKWQFAQQARRQGYVEQNLKQILKGQDAAPGVTAKANVSKLFSRYNKLISAMTQEIVKVMNSNKTETDKWFIIRGQLLASMYTQRVDDPGFLEVMQYSLAGQCRESLEAARITRDALTTDDEKKAAEFAKKLDVKSRWVSLSAARWMAAVTLGKKYTAEQVAANPVAYRTEFYMMVMRFRIQPFSCRDFWAYIYDGLVRRGLLVVEEMQKFSKSNDIDPAKMLNQIAGAAGLNTDENGGNTGNAAESVQRLARVVALYMFRNSMQTEGTSGMIADKATRGRESPRIQVPLEGELAITESVRTTSTEWGEKTRLMLAASNLPYYQGLLLFGLGLSFPFFALMLLIPGKHGGFMLWFVLWLWVKSWDIGMAVVMQLDDVLFSLLALTKRKIQGADMIRNDLEWVAMVFREIDPTFHLSTYYNIIACSLLSIPIISSQLIMGSLNGGAGLVAAGQQLFTGEFARAAQSTQVAGAISNLKYELEDFTRARAETIQNTRLGLPQATRGGPSGAVQVAFNGDQIRMVQPESVGLKAPDPWAKLGGMGDHGLGRDPQNLARGGRAPLIRSVPLFEQNILEPSGVAMGTVADRWDTSRWMRRLEGLGRAMHSPTRFSADFLDRFMFLANGKRAFQDMLFGKGDKFQEALAGTGKFGENFLGAIRGVIDESVEQDLKTTGTHAISDAYYSERGRRLAFMIKLYGAIEVPITAKNAPDDAETEKIFEMRKAEFKAYGKVLEAFASVADTIENIKDQGAKNKALQGMADKLQGAGFDIHKMNWADPKFQRFLGGSSSSELKRLFKRGGPIPGSGHVSMRGAGEFDALDVGAMGGSAMLAFADVADGGDGGDFAWGIFGGHGIGGGDGGNRWMESSDLLRNGGGSTSVAMGGIGMGGGGDGPEGDAGDSHFRVSPILGDRLNVESVSSNLFAYASVDNKLFEPSSAFTPPADSHTAQAGSDHYKSNAFEPVNLDAHPEGEKRNANLLAYVGFGELPVDLPADIRYIIEHNPGQAEEAIAEYLRKRGGGGNGGGSLT